MEKLESQNKWSNRYTHTVLQKIRFISKLADLTDKLATKSHRLYSIIDITHSKP